MPATSLTKVVTAPYSEGIIDVGYEAVDQPNGNDFANTGKEILLIANGSGGSVIVSVAPVAGRNTWNLATAKTLTVLTTKTGILGPFPQDVYGPTVTIDYDTGTTITAAVITLTSP